MQVLDIPGRQVHSDAVEVLAVSLDGVSYAVPVAEVVEVLPAMAAVPLPKSPSVIEGVVNVRGALIPLLNLRSRLGVPSRQPRAEDHFVVCQVGRRLVAVRVDRAEALCAVPMGDIDAARVVAPTEHLAGVAPLADGILLVCDLQSFLGAEEALALEAALAGAPRDRVP